jgi:hypothetical protein
MYQYINENEKGYRADRYVAMVLRWFGDRRTKQLRMELREG